MKLNWLQRIVSPFKVKKPISKRDRKSLTIILDYVDSQDSTSRKALAEHVDRIRKWLEGQA